jgi:isochorismate hydrolase
MQEIEARLIRLTDDELVHALYDLIDELEEWCDQDAIADELYWHVQELLERIAPALEEADQERRVVAHCDPETRDQELADRRYSRRQREAARLIHRTTGDA